MQSNANTYTGCTATQVYVLIPTIRIYIAQVVVGQSCAEGHPTS